MSPLVNYHLDDGPMSVTCGLGTPSLVDLVDRLGDPLPPHPSYRAWARMVGI